MSLCSRDHGMPSWLEIIVMGTLSVAALAFEVVEGVRYLQRRRREPQDVGE